MELGKDKERDNELTRETKPRPCYRSWCLLQDPQQAIETFLNGRGGARRGGRVTVGVEATGGRVVCAGNAHPVIHTAHLTPSQAPGYA